MYEEQNEDSRGGNKDKNYDKSKQNIEKIKKKQEDRKSSTVSSSVIKSGTSNTSSGNKMSSLLSEVGQDDVPPEGTKEVIDNGDSDDEYKSTTIIYEDPLKIKEEKKGPEIIDKSEPNKEKLKEFYKIHKQDTSEQFEFNDG